ncbi:MAG: DUF1015 domain-containing protein [Deltaproteobacteria bacterium]|nr:DUF1015 domain-containing protein [Deltaproteobacteria bacterium]
MTQKVIAPFKGFHYNPEKIKDLAQVVAPPYDVIDEKYRDRLYDQNPYNVVKLILTKDQDAPAGKTKYDAARGYLDQWKQDQVLVQDQTPQIYLYHQTYTLEDGRQLTRKGFIARRRIESFEEGKIRPHEYTFAGPKADRLNLTKATETNLSPIFGIFSDSKRETEALFQSTTSQKPLFDLKTDDGNRHQLWLIGDEAIQSKLNQIMSDKVILIADGHHRYETALNYRNLKRAENPAAVDSAYDYVMMYCCAMEDEGLVILPTHRVVKVPLNDSLEAIQQRLAASFTVTSYSKADQKKALAHLAELSQHQIAFLVSLKGDQLLLLATDAKRVAEISELKSYPAPVRELDVVILHQYLLPHIFRVDAAEDHDSVKVQYVKDTQEALSYVEKGEATLSFILNPTKIAQVESVSSIGERMPHKSTFFYPKLLSGLVFNPLV